MKTMLKNMRPMVKPSPWPNDLDKPCSTIKSAKKLRIGTKNSTNHSAPSPVIWQSVHKFRNGISDFHPAWFALVKIIHIDTTETAAIRSENIVTSEFEPSIS